MRTSHCVVCNVELTTEKAKGRLPKFCAVHKRAKKGAETESYVESSEATA